jgi:hypothetical protein
VTDDSLIGDHFLLNQLVATFIQVDNYAVLAIVHVTAMENELKKAVSTIPISALSSEKVLFCGQVLSLERGDTCTSWLWRHGNFESFNSSDSQITKKSSLIKVPAVLTRSIKGELHSLQPMGHALRFKSGALEAVADLLWSSVKAVDKLKAIPSWKCTKTFPCRNTEGNIHIVFLQRPG